MKGKVAVGLALTLALMIVLAQAQRPGGGTGGQRRAGGQRQMGQQAGQQQRQRAGATQEQQKQYRVCTEALNRIRSRIRQMTRLAAAQPFNAQQMQALQEQLRVELQEVEQQQAQLTESLNEQQRTAVQDRLAEIAKHQQDLDSFTEALGFELDQAALQETKVREQVKKLDTAAKELQKQQRELGSELEIE